MNSNFEDRYETLQKRPGRFETLKKTLVHIYDARFETLQKRPPLFETLKKS